MKEKDSQLLNFGKYYRQSPLAVSRTDPSYIIWLYENIKPSPCSRELYKVCKDREETLDPEMMEHYENGGDRE
jgi:hypothetical protein